LTFRDRFIVVGLVALLTILSVAIGAPAFSPAAAPGEAGSSVKPSPSPPPMIYREGIVGLPASINPLTARTQADRDIVALVFSGLVRHGPNGTVLPDLAERWTVGDKGASYTFTLRPDAVWQDAQPVTSADVVFTVETLQDPTYTGPAAGSWREVTATAIDERTVRFDLATPLGGFLQAATQPLLPMHLLENVPPASLAEDPFSARPIGSGPYRLVHWDAAGARLEPAVAAGGAQTGAPSPSAASTAPSAAPTPPASGLPSSAASPSAASYLAQRSAGLASPSPASAPPSSSPSKPSRTPSPASASPSAGPPLPSAAGASVTPAPPAGAVTLPAIELHFYDDPTALMVDYRAGRLDAASGLAPGEARDLAAAAGARLLRYPRTTFTGVVLNQRPGHPEFRSQDVRRNLLAVINRAALIDSALAGIGQRADSPVPPSSWPFDPTAATAVAYDPAGAAKALVKLGWKKAKSGWIAPNAKARFTIELMAPDQVSSPIVYATAIAVAGDWRRFGIDVNLVDLPVREFTERLSTGQFQAAIVDVDVGLDPDLYPFLASTQTTTGGANVSGIQVRALDQKLVAARRYASTRLRLAAFRDLQVYLGQSEPTLPLYFRDSPFVIAERVWGPLPTVIGDESGRYWDVLTWRLANGR
jgi:ABC-type transport system substrate-binding protein